MHWSQSLSDPNPPPQAVTTLTQMQKKIHQFYTVCGSEATICKTVEQSALPPPHLDMLIPTPQRAENPRPLRGRTRLSCGPLGGAKPLGVKAGSRGTSTLVSLREPLVNWNSARARARACVCVQGGRMSPP